MFFSLNILIYLQIKNRDLDKFRSEIVRFFIFLLILSYPRNRAKSIFYKDCSIITSEDTSNCTKILAYYLHALYAANFQLMVNIVLKILLNIPDTMPW